MTTPDQEAIDALAEARIKEALAMSLIAAKVKYEPERQAKFTALNVIEETIAQLRSRGFDIVRKE